jgi:2-polyprenyl-3-methyl-5-hydroxy-6-metoxy-1,4-benzoquinol methylase
MSTNLDLGDDPVAMLEATTWALAALVGTLRDATTTPLADVLEKHPQRTAVLEAAGLVSREGDVLTLHPSLVYADEATARNVVEARLSILRQAVAAATGAPGAGWADQDDAVLLNQGRASAMAGRALATRIVPALPGLAERLDAQGSRILDVGTGVAALALALARELPHAEITGIDVMERVLHLARKELAEAEEEAAARVLLRHQDVVDLTEQAAYDLAWLATPFLNEAELNAAIPRLVQATKPGGWLVAATIPAPPDPLRRAVAAWTAVRNGGNSYDTDRIAQAFTAAGLEDARRFPTIPGGPVLLAVRKPAD